MSEDNINHPTHYCIGKFEVIDVIEALLLNPDYHIGCAIKYISRAGKKVKSKELEDLQKAEWYLNRILERELFPNIDQPIGNIHIMYNDYQLDKYLKQALYYIVLARKSNLNTYFTMHITAAVNLLGKRIRRLMRDKY